MKNLITILLLSISLNSCSKDEVTPEPQPEPTKILSDAFTFTMNTKDQSEYTTHSKIEFSLYIDTVNYLGKDIEINFKEQPNITYYKSINGQLFELTENTLLWSETDLVNTPFYAEIETDGSYSIDIEATNGVQDTTITKPISTNHSDLIIDVQDKIDTIGVSSRDKNYFGKEINVDVIDDNLTQGWYKVKVEALENNEDQVTLLCGAHTFLSFEGGENVNKYTYSCQKDENLEIGTYTDYRTNHEYDVHWGLNTFTVQYFKDDNEFIKSNIDTVKVWVRGYPIQGGFEIAYNGDNFFKKGEKYSNPNNFITLNKERYHGNFYIDFQIFDENNNRVDNAFDFEIKGQKYSINHPIKFSHKDVDVKEDKQLQVDITANGDVGEYRIESTIYSEEGWEDHKSTNYAHIKE